MIDNCMVDFTQLCSRHFRLNASWNWVTVYIVSRDLKPCDQFGYIQPASEIIAIYLTCSFKDLLSQKSSGCVKSEKNNLPIDYTFIFVQVYPFIHYTPLEKPLKRDNLKRRKKRMVSSCTGLMDMMFQKWTGGHWTLSAGDLFIYLFFTLQCGKNDTYVQFKMLKCYQHQQRIESWIACKIGSKCAWSTRGGKVDWDTPWMNKKNKNTPHYFSLHWGWVQNRAHTPQDRVCLSWCLTQG